MLHMACLCLTASKYWKLAPGAGKKLNQCVTAEKLERNLRSFVDITFGL